MGTSSVFSFWLVCICVVSSNSALLPEVHKLVDAHFRHNCYGVDLYFCKFEDAVESLRFAWNNTRANRRVKVMRTMEEDDGPVAEKFTHRASVFLDASCDEGLQLLSRSALKMDLRFRWLIFTEDVFSVYQTLDTSRLEMDSDVTLIRIKKDRTLEFSRLSRIHFKSYFTLTANYSLQETTRNDKLSRAILWRGEDINFGNYSFDACVLFLTTKYYNLWDWPLLLNRSVEHEVENVRKLLSHAAWYLMEMYNFTLNVTNINDWGVQLPNGSFTGAFGLVARRDVEFSFTGVRPDPDRATSMDFSVTVLESRFNFILIQPKTFGTAAALIVPFQPATWLVFLVLVLMLIGTMRISILSDREQQHNDSWGGSFLLVFGGISQNGIPDSASKFSSRVIYLVTLLSLFLIFLYYSAAVLNGLILPSPDPIQNIEQLLLSDTKLGGVDALYIQRELMKNDSITLRARQKLIPNPFLPIQEGIQRVAKGRFALYGLDRFLWSAMQEQFTEDERCLITEIQMVRQLQLSFFWRKKSPYGEIINRGLIKLKEHGIVDYLQKYWLVQKPKCTVKLFFGPIKVQGITMAYGVLAAGVVISLKIAILELVIAKRLGKRTQALQFVP